MESGTTAATETGTPETDRHHRSHRPRGDDRTGGHRSTPPRPPETNPDWTYRFFIPTLLVLAALVVIVTVIQYFTRVVRNRYRIVR